MQRTVPVWLLFLVLHSKLISGSTLLRTAVISRGAPSELEWLSNSAHRRQLLGYHECSDPRWGPLCGKTQLLLQLADGYTSQNAQRIASQLHADGAIISSSLPKDTWLVLANIDALKPATYQPHGLVPYSPQYKLAPEWNPVLEYVQQQQMQQHPVQDSTHHVQVHKRILEHDLLERLQVTSTAQHLQQAAAAATADTALGHELKQGTPGKVLIGVHFAEIPEVALQRLKVQAGSFHPAAAAVKDWQEQLTDVVMAAKRCQHHKQLCQPELTARSPWELDVAVCPQDLSEVLYWLSNQAVVHWLAPRPRLYLQNLAASANIQSSTMKTALDYRAAESHVFWNAGLDGKNQIVGIGDSGIDMHSCFFSDPQVPFVAPPQQGMEWANPLHRKVVYYWGLGDDRYRDLVGHGTHTAGSIAGFNPAAPDSKATGAARSARLAFADLSRTAGGDVNAPQDLEANYFPKLRQQGACIFSDSWGSTSPIYDFQASKLDSWLYKNQDCISHFAAGNYGENDNLDSTITSPATAKNAVTVGATKSPIPNYISQTIAKVFMMSVEIKRANKTPQYVGVRLVKADFGGDGATLANKGLRVIRASPETACSALQGPAGAYQDAIVLARRGSCYFSEKLSAGAAASAAAVVVINDKPGGYFKMDAQESRGAPDNIPLFAVTRRIGEQLWSFFENAESVAATIELYAQGWPAYEDIASFSSFGPTADGRIKPDIVAPGELVSAASADADGETAETCNVLRKSGTSMATPLVAGHTAIIRQYFMDGFYPTGVAGNTAHIPSGPLMKAIMLGGACDMQGNTEQYLPLEDSPSMRQGFGRFCLCNSLKLMGGADNCTTNVQLVDRVPIKSQESHKYCLHTTGAGDVRVTLVWYDFPAQPSAEKTLVNDLDLVVISGGMGGQSFFGNMDLKKDSLNTVERVWLRNVPPGGLEITVTAGMLSPNTESQNYSLVVQGAFTETLNSRYNPDPSAGRTPAGCPATALMAATVPAATPTPPAGAPPAVVNEKGVVAPATATVAGSAVAAAVITQGSASPAAAPTPASTAPQAATAAAPVATPAVAPVPAATTAPAAAPVDAVVPVAPAISPVATPTVSPVATPAAAAVDAAAAQAAAAVATPPAAPAAPVAAPVAAQPVAAPAVAPAAVAAPLPNAATAVEGLTATAQADPTALVSALVGAMQSQAAQTQSVQGSSTPAVRDPAATQGRRLTWTPQSMQAWVKEQAPLFVCRWINASSCKAVAAEGQPVTGRSLKAHAGTQPAAALLSPVQQVVLGAVALLACAVLLSVGLRPSRIVRSVSLTSAVHQDQSLNKAQGKAPAGNAALHQALLNSPGLTDQLSPTKRAALGLPTSPFEGCPGFSRPGSNSSTSSGAQEGSNGGGLGLITPAHSAPDTPHGGAAASPATSLPISYLRVQLGRHSAAGASLPVPYRPYSARTGAMSASRSAPFPVMHSAPVSPVGTPLLGSSDSDSLSSHSVRICPGGNGSSADLEALLAERPVSRVSDSMLPLPGLAASPDSFTAEALAGLRRCSQSFTFGNAAALPAASAPAELSGCEVFGLAGPSARTPHATAAAYTPEQLRTKSMQEHSVLHVQEREVLLAHWRPLSPELTAAAAAAAAAAAPSGRHSVDAVQPHDQRPSWQGRVSSP